MANKKSLGSAKRFGTRYGRSIKAKFAKIEAEQRRKHKCPYCNFQQVRRVSVGVWQCMKPNCSSTFTAKAYTVPKKRRRKEEEAVIEETVKKEEQMEEEHEDDVKPTTYKEALPEKEEDAYEQPELSDLEGDAGEEMEGDMGEEEIGLEEEAPEQPVEEVAESEVKEEEATA